MSFGTYCWLTPSSQVELQKERIKVLEKQVVSLRTKLDASRAANKLLVQREQELKSKITFLESAHVYRSQQLDRARHDRDVALVTLDNERRAHRVTADTLNDARKVIGHQAQQLEAHISPAWIDRCYATTAPTTVGVLKVTV